MNVGELNVQVDLLELEEAEENIYGWAAKKRIWAKVEYPEARAIYSKIGAAARSAKITVHKGLGITLHNAVALAPPGSGHFCLTGINGDAPWYCVAAAAIVSPVLCTVERTLTGKGANNRPTSQMLPPLIFPGYLTEKYMRQTQGEPMSHSEARLVLVAPKAIAVQAGELVEIGGLQYEMAVAHMLDPYKNEYEIVRRADN